MTVDITKTAFTTEYPIDKIIAQGVETFTIPAVSIQSNFLNTIPNPYGKKGLTTASWSIDGTNFYDQGSPLYYAPDPLDYVIGFQVLVGCDDNNIYFFSLNGFVTGVGYTAPQNVTVNWTVANIL